MTKTRIAKEVKNENKYSIVYTADLLTHLQFDHYNIVSKYGFVKKTRSSRSMEKRNQSAQLIRIMRIVAE